MLPVGVEELTQNGHQVIVEAGAEVLVSGLPDHDYLRAGAELVSTPGGSLLKVGHDREGKRTTRSRVAADSRGTNAISLTSTLHPVVSLTQAMVTSGADLCSLRDFTK